jgi:hypothetical protein
MSSDPMNRISCSLPYGDDDDLDLDDTHNGVVIDDGDDDDDADRLLDSAGGVTGAGYELLGVMDARGDFV